MKNTRQRYQQGTLRKVVRKSGAEVWEYRYRDHSEKGSPERQMTLSVTERPTERKARIALQAQLLKINGADAFRAHQEPTLGVVIDRYIQEERLVEIMAQPPGETTITDGLAYSTATVYNSLIKAHIPTVGKHLPKPCEAFRGPRKAQGNAPRTEEQVPHQEIASSSL